MEFPLRHRAAVWKPSSQSSGKTVVIKKRRK
ncbi:Ras homolog enriched in brain, isoform CRA_d [Rattus norvegicus]|uniref:Ras homolog enriched in brain, isoform CRA_d n=1 Tax=Rattus norvegicus TaxID=10116 RepID=A6KJH5_RAT|nr:Ras homolog enriched in brain, isoform CRA_d [Rattus norvegicus]